MLGMTQIINAQGIEFFHGSWEEALAEATKQEKLIFVDAYAEWCGPCKRMAKNVFTQPAVGDFFNKHFINVKMDMEKGEGPEFGMKYPVSAYPTLMFIDFSGEMVHKVKGAQSVDGFLKLGELALSKIDRSGTYQEAYDNGDRSPELIYNLVKSLNTAGKSSLAISNEYLRGQTDLNTEFNLKFILEAAVEADSRIFDMMIERKSEITKLVGKEAFLDRVEQACHNTVSKALEFEVASILEEAKAKMDEHHPDALAFNLMADRQFARATGDVDGYLKACNTYAKKVAKNDPQALHTLAKEIERDFLIQPDCMDCAEKIAKMAAQKGDLYTYHYTYATILLHNGKEKEALAAAETSLKMAKKMDDQGASQMVQELINKINS